MPTASKIIDGSYLDVRRVAIDARGWFSEITKTTGEFSVVNVSMSKRNVLRGMHLQTKNPQAKLVTCLKGSIFDVAIDLRPKSRTFLAVESHLLTDMNGEKFFIPAGCAHGFYVLSDEAIVQYSCSTDYDPSSDGGVSWRSDGIREVFMPYCPGRPITSEKDRELPLLEQWLSERGNRPDGQAISRK